MADQHIQWNFVVEKTPWWGGFWEQMVQSVKRCLRKAVGSATLNYDQLNTLLIEIETVINARRLKYISDDQDGATFTLSPSHLINGRIANSPNTAHFDVVSTYQSLYRRTKSHFHLLNQFTKCWRRQYLLSLRENQQATAIVKNRQSMTACDSGFIGFNIIFNVE